MVLVMDNVIKPLIKGQMINLVNAKTDKYFIQLCNQQSPTNVIHFMLSSWCQQHYLFNDHFPGQASKLVPECLHSGFHWS